MGRAALFFPEFVGATADVFVGDGVFLGHFFGQVWN
jgi:hypothetical protein